MDEVDEYIELIDRVRELDPEAAEYLINEAPLLGSFHFSNKLDSVFRWSETPQYIEHWFRIDDELKK